MKRVLWWPILFSLASCQGFNMKPDDFMEQRERMVETQIISRGISDPRVINAMLKVERHLFVLPASARLAYADHPLPIGYEQTISQPYIVACMTEAAQLKQTDKVLEIGTGSGYQAAVLAEIVKQVYTIEIVSGLAESAQKRLKSLGYHNIFVKQGDGFEGWAQHAPFDAVIVTAAPGEVPRKLLEQLKIGGRMVIPMGSADQELFLITKTADGYEQKSLLPVRFVPMIKSRED